MRLPIEQRAPVALYISLQPFENGTPMPRKRSNQPTPQERYWQRRVRSTAFRRGLTAAVAHELDALSAQYVKDVLDPGLVRTLIQEWNVRLVDRKVAATLLIQMSRQLAARLNRQRESVGTLFDKQLVADVGAIFSENGAFSPPAKDFVEKIMEQEFVRQLLTDVAFTAIVSFYQRVNPFFGALAMLVLEDQIKGFIRLFMPALQRQAIAFAVSRDNQRIVLELTGSIIRQLLDQPLRQYAAGGSPGRQKKLEKVIRQALGNAQLEALIRDATLGAFDDLYKTIRSRKVGDLLRLDAHAGWLAERIIELILPVLSRPHVLKFVAAEMSVAGTDSATRQLLK